MYYDVVVNNDLSKCEQLYNALMMVDCKGLTKSASYLCRAVKKRVPEYIRYAYRIYVEDDGIYYHSFRNIDEVRKEISLTDFINIIKPERTVTL